MITSLFDAVDFAFTAGFDFDGATVFVAADFARGAAFCPAAVLTALFADDVLGALAAGALAAGAFAAGAFATEAFAAEAFAAEALAAGALVAGAFAAEAFAAGAFAAEAFAAGAFAAGAFAAGALPAGALAAGLFAAGALAAGAFAAEALAAVGFAAAVLAAFGVALAVVLPVGFFTEGFADGVVLDFAAVGFFPIDVDAFGAESSAKPAAVSSGLSVRSSEEAVTPLRYQLATASPGLSATISTDAHRTRAPTAHLCVSCAPDHEMATSPTLPRPSQTESLP